MVIPKICDRINDAILDACLSQDPNSRVAVECAIKGNLLCLLGEITTKACIDPVAIARDVLRATGHANARWGLDPESINVTVALDRQSPDIARGVDGDDIGAGDQGIIFGFSCDEMPEFLPLPIALAHALLRRHKAVHETAEGAFLGPDAKAQVTISYKSGRPAAVDTVVLSTQHERGFPQDRLRRYVEETIIAPVLLAGLPGPRRVLLNPTDVFEIGGPMADAGLTGRKIMVDT
jgi:S-adenosylmethionine synthetase